MIFLHVIISLVFMQFGSQQEKNDSSFNQLYPILNEYVKDFPKEFRKIPEERRYRLNEIVYFLEEQQKANDPIRLVFISTNQSSVSHMSQIWAKTAAYYFGIENFQSFSGGIKPNEITLNTILALEKAGFIIYKTEVDAMDVYQVKYSYNLKPIVIFSKKLSHLKNPYDNFMAVFTDSNADLNIQNIKGTYNRLLLTYDDPAGYDGSGLETRIYDDNCRKIAVEMFYVFSQFRKRAKNN